ncbi:MAG TPA: Crp/Fnr family transcriptional regulator [Caulobacterales bacterium]|nr:Crp/Fnr family transcriptional regulator [Caulobacterales bacterium]
MRAEDLKNVEAALARAEIYSEFSDEMRARLGAAGVLVNLAPEQLLFSKGDPGDSLFVLLEGEVEVRTSTEAGKDVRLAALKPPALIGEMAVLDGGERSADVAAIRRSRLVRISRDAAIEALTSEPKALLKLVSVLSRRLRRANEELEDAAVLDLGGKLAQRLLEEAGASALVTLTQTELARRIGASREKVNRKLHEWADEGWVNLSRSGIKLTKRDQLQALIRSARSG